jgi:hypothetical protein
LPSATGTVYAYSPIDICVAAIEAYRQDLIIEDLSRFFTRTRPFLSEFDTYIGIIINNNLIVNNVVYWQSMSGLGAMLHNNAPLTFRRKYE